jgi:hypothetical protein
MGKSLWDRYLDKATPETLVILSAVLTIIAWFVYGWPVAKWAAVLTILALIAAVIQPR